MGTNGWRYAGFQTHPIYLIPTKGLEPLRSRHLFLRQACLPFHQAGLKGIYKAVGVLSFKISNCSFSHHVLCRKAYFRLRLL